MRSFPYMLVASPALLLAFACTDASPLGPSSDAGAGAGDAQPGSSDGGSSKDASSSDSGNGDGGSVLKPGTPVVLAKVPLDSWGLAAAGDSVFVGAPGSARNSLTRVPKNGGASTTGYFVAPQPEEISAFGTVDSELLLLLSQASGAGRALRVVRKDPANGTETVLATQSSPDKRFWGLVGSDTSTIYIWERRNSRLDVYRLPKSGGTLEGVFYTYSDVYDLQLAGGDLWFTASNGSLFRVPKTSVSVLATEVASGLFCTYGMAVRDDAIYCAGGDGKVDRMALDLTGRKTLYDAAMPLRADLKDASLRLSLATPNGFLFTFNLDAKAPVADFDKSTEKVTPLPWGDRPVIKAMTADAQGTFWLEEERGFVNEAQVVGVGK